MHYSTVMLLIILLLASCQQKPDEQASTAPTDHAITDTTAVLNSSANRLNIQTHSFSEIDSSGIVLFPLSMGESPGDGTRSSYKAVPENHYWNMIFYNSKTGSQHPLTEQKMLIRNVDIYYNRAEALSSTQTRKHIFYRVITDDFNKDKKLTTEDPDYLFVSDKEGKNFRQLSPDGHHVKTWQFIQSANKVLMTLTKESNGNSAFDEKDEVVAFQVEMDKDTAATEVFSQSFKNKLKILYDREWKRLED